MSIAELRKAYHSSICQEVLRVSDGLPNLADSSSRASKEISLSIVEQLGYATGANILSGQSRGNQFQNVTRQFLESAFRLISHLRPGNWAFAISGSISQFEQYKHLAYLQEALRENPKLASALGGDYLVTPDIVVVRYPVTDSEINYFAPVVSPEDQVSRYTSLRAANYSENALLLHASVSCKWTLRSDRAQNVRTEALNLIRNRKGHTPHIVVVTAEPLPTRLASIALGTGDLDCVYHFALHELHKAVIDTGSSDQLDMLQGMVEGQRLRDISDLPFDLAI